MDEARPHQSEFLKTLIEKSNRKNKSALRNIYESINKKHVRGSQRKSSRRRQPKKYIELGENTRSKEAMSEAPKPPQHSIANHELPEPDKAARGSVQSRQVKPRDKEKDAEAKRGETPAKGKRKAEVKYSFPLSTKTKDIREGINLGYYFSSQFMRNKHGRYPSSKNPKSLNSVNFTENFFDPRQPKQKKMQTKLNTSHDRVHNSHLKNFSRNKGVRSKHKKAILARNEPSLLTPSNLLFTNTQRTSSIENSKKKHFLLSSFSRNKSGKKVSAYNHRTELAPERAKKESKTPTNYMSVNYSKPLDNLYLQGSSSAKRNTSTMTPVGRNDKKKYELKLFSEKKNLQETTLKTLREQTASAAKDKSRVASKDRSKEEVSAIKRQKSADKEKNSEAKRRATKKVKLSIQTGENASLHTINQNFNKKKGIRSECGSGLEDCLATQKENTDEKKKAKKIQEYLDLLRSKCGASDSQFAPETRDIRARVVGCFKNWRSTSLAEFFDFKSNKSLYKIKVI